MYNIYTNVHTHIFIFYDDRFAHFTDTVLPAYMYIDVLFFVTIPYLKCFLLKCSYFVHSGTLFINDYEICVRHLL